jgi:hypothetical protein
VFVDRLVEGREMKLIKGWKKLKHECGFLNDCTGQTLVVCKKEFSQNYHVLLFPGRQIEKGDSKKISPDFPTETKADAFAVDWMEKHPNGLVS